MSKKPQNKDDDVGSDVMTPEQRSHCMSRIRGKDTKPEITLRKALWARGVRYRKQYKITGKPDLAFPGKKVAVFVDGCFWHGCPDHSSIPKKNTDFWQSKLQKNIERDKNVSNILESEGWMVMRFWEHEIKKNVNDVAEQILEVLNQL